MLTDAEDMCERLQVGIDQFFEIETEVASEVDIGSWGGRWVLRAGREAEKPSLKITAMALNFSETLKNWEEIREEEKTKVENNHKNSYKNKRGTKWKLSQHKKNLPKTLATDDSGYVVSFNNIHNSQFLSAVKVLWLQFQGHKTRLYRLENFATPVDPPTMRTILLRKAQPSFRNDWKHRKSLKQFVGWDWFLWVGVQKCANRKVGCRAYSLSLVQSTMLTLGSGSKLTFIEVLTFNN